MTIPANLQELVINILIRLATDALVVLIGWWLARQCRKWVKRAAERAKLTLSMVNLLTFTTYYGILLLTALVALSVLGIPLTSMVAISGAVVVTVGIALKETLADLAAAIIFYLFQPFKVGDTIESTGVIGKVLEIQLFFTVIQTASNRVVTTAQQPPPVQRHHQLLNARRASRRRAGGDSLLRRSGESPAPAGADAPG